MTKSFRNFKTTRLNPNLPETSILLITVLPDGALPFPLQVAPFVFVDLQLLPDRSVEHKQHQDQNPSIHLEESTSSTHLESSSASSCTPPSGNS